MSTVTAPHTATGTYAIDPSHSRIGFVARHAMVTKVRGSFNEFEGTGYFDYLKQDGDFDMVRAGWIGDYNDPQNFLFLYESDNLGFNYPRWVNKEYDELMARAETTLDLKERGNILRQAEEIFLKELPAIPILYYSSRNLVSSKVKGWEENLLDHHPSRFVTIER